MLWQSFREGDSYAFEQLLKQYYPLLLNYGNRLSKDREFVKDCLHDLFVELWNRKEKLDTIENLKPYLLLSFRRKLLRETKKDQMVQGSERSNGRLRPGSPVYHRVVPDFEGGAARVFEKIEE